MPLTYERRDYSIRLTADGSYAVIAVTRPQGKKSETRIARAIIDRACASPVPALPSDLENAALSRLPANFLRQDQQWAPPKDPVEIGRLTVETGVREWSVLPWESALPAKSVVVRTTPVRPRVLQIPITFPIRILELGGATPLVPDAIQWTFRETSRTLAYIEAHTTLTEAEAVAKEKKWATVEVLHIHQLPADPELLTTRHDSEPGTLGWLLRFADRFQTRLIVLDGYTEVPAVHRQLAQTIIERGGPAVLLLGAVPAPQLETLYADIAHDRPLDWIRAQVPGSELFAGAGGEESLRYSAIEKELAKRHVASAIKKAYASQIRSPRKTRTKPASHKSEEKNETAVKIRTLEKAGVPKVKAIKKAAEPKIKEARKAIVKQMDKGEKAIKVAIRESAKGFDAFDGKNIRFGDLYGTRAERFGHAVAAQLPRMGRVATDLGSDFEILRSESQVVSVSELAGRIAKRSRRLATVSRPAAVKILAAKLSGISHSKYEYEDQESHGMLPLAARIADVKSFVDATRTAKKAPKGPRHVNSAFYTVGSDGRLKKIRQSNARLRPGEMVHLGVQIGPKDKVTITLGPTRFLEETIRWEAEGAWIEIGVTGIDFDVAGHAVQEVYLHRQEPTDLITFAVTPRAKTTVPGIARLRFTIYHRNNIVQSFFVAAALEGAKGNVAVPMARALNVPKEDAKKISSAGYIARLEYSNVASIGDAACATPRAFTILANDSVGDKITTFKGDDLFGVTNVNLTNEAKKAREALLSASRRGVAYRFDNQNAGAEAELCDILWPIAQAGWQIYNNLVPNPNDQDVVRSLIEQGGGIQAAHLDVAGAIPWSVIYDRQYFYDKNLPVAPPEVCRASFPDPKTGKLPNVECGSDDCLLNAARNAALRSKNKPEYAAESVICPRRFWGFMFPIDIPVQKVDRMGKKSSNLPEEIQSVEPLNVVVGYNSNLDFAKEHVEQVTKDIVGKRSTASVTPQTGRGPVWSLLRHSDPTSFTSTATGSQP